MLSVSIGKEEDDPNVAAESIEEWCSDKNEFAALFGVNVVNVTSKFWCMYRYRKIVCKILDTERIKFNLLKENKGHTVTCLKTSSSKPNIYSARDTHFYYSVFLFYLKIL